MTDGKNTNFSTQKSDYWSISSRMMGWYSIFSLTFLLFSFFLPFFIRFPVSQFLNWNSISSILRFGGNFVSPRYAFFLVIGHVPLVQHHIIYNFHIIHADITCLGWIPFGYRFWFLSKMRVCVKEFLAFFWSSLLFLLFGPRLFPSFMIITVSVIKR